MLTNHLNPPLRILLLAALLVALLAALVVLATPPVATAAPDPYFEYLQKYRCPVADRLERLFDAGDPTKDRDRFIAVTLLEHKFGSVQCLFHDHETAVLCEAASGFYDDTPGTPRTMRLAPDKIAALARLGFSTDDSAGNFRLDLAVPQPPDFGRIADVILRALSDGYAPGLTLACDPVG